MHSVLNIGEKQIAGVISGTGADTKLELYDRDFFLVNEPDLFGTSFDGSRISLLNCIALAHGTHSRNVGDDWDGSHYVTIFPHIIAIGNYHLVPENTLIQRAHVLPIRDKELFYDPGVFGEVLWPGDHVRNAIKKQSKDIGRSIAMGKYPRMWYFSGKDQIKLGRTEKANLELNNFFSNRYGVDGVHVDNKRYISIKFRKPVSFRDTETTIRDLMLFLGMILGGHVFPTDVKLEVAHKSASSSSLLPMVEVTWNLWRARREASPEERLHPVDLPLRVSDRPKEFSQVLTNWFGKQAQRRESRHRFAECFSKGNDVDIDRMVGAANMFDILPSEARPRRGEIPSELAAAIKYAQGRIRSVSPSPERDGLLDAFGRVGRASLPKIVEHRAKIITDKIGSTLPKLDFVLRHAIKCRNRYVHGTAGPFEYEDHFEMVDFFVRALEFVFAASELVEAGWDIERWEREGTTLSHPFKRFIESYQRNLRDLTSLSLVGSE